MLDEFIAYLESQKGCPYLYGGQGTVLNKQNYKTVINQHESSSKDRQRVINFVEKNIFGKKKTKTLSFDCSGLGMYFLQNLKAIYKYDMNANSMLGKCTKITKANLKKGDWVFKCNILGKATHIGYIVDNALNVIESQGRDAGVVKRPLSAGGWNKYGRPECFKSEIEKPVKPSPTPTPTPTPAPAPTWKCNRNLKLTKPYMKGDDVKALQNALNKLGYSTGTADGIFGSKTKEAVIAFQKAKKLTADGIAGKNTITALGGVWG